MSYVNSIKYDYKSYFITESLSKVDHMLSFYMHGKPLNDFMSAAILRGIFKIDQLIFFPALVIRVLLYCLFYVKVFVKREYIGSHRRF